MNKNSKLYQRRGVLILSALCLALASFLLFRFSLEEPAKDTPSNAPVAAEARFGPGTWNNSKSDDPPDDKAIEFNPLDAVSTSANGHLIVNKALLHAINFFMLNGDDGDRIFHANQLQTQLRNKFSPLVYEEAQKILQNYLSYMDVHDGLLTRQAINVSAADVNISLPLLERISIWNEQRSRLRQSAFGIEIAQIWFGDEETQARQLLEELRANIVLMKRSATAENGEIESDSNIAPIQRIRENALASQASRDAQEWLTKLTQSFAGIERQEHQWKTHFANYLQALTQLDGLDISERNKKMDALRDQMLTVAERERARALGK